jgi:hypothetical protein
MWLLCNPIRLLLKQMKNHKIHNSAGNRLKIAASIMLSHGIPPIIVAGVIATWSPARFMCGPNFGRMLGHSLAILMTTYAHLARFARYKIFQGPRMKQLA